MHSKIIAALILGVFLAAPDDAAAQLEFGAERPRIFSIQERPYRLEHEFQLGIGTLPLDAFYVGAVAAAGYTYHFTDFWAWEIAGGGYSLNFDTGLQDNLRDEYGVEAVRNGGERIVAFATTNVVVKPLFGKLAVFNSDVVYSETFFSAGVGPLRKGDFWRFTANIGMGFRFWSSQALSFRFDIRDYLTFIEVVPESVFFLMLSASLNVNDSVQSGGASTGGK